MLTLEEKDKWVVALESGKYPQTQFALRYGKGYCCLGVLCDVVDPSGWETPIKYPEMYKYNGTFTDNNGVIDSRLTNAIVSTLVTMNDGGTHTFSEIAKWVRENVPVIEDQQ